MRRRHLVWMVIGLLILSVALAGCGGSKQQASDQKPAPVKKLELLMATGGTAGTYYPLGGAIAQVWNSSYDKVNVTVQSSGASAENVRLLDSKNADLALAMNNIAEDAYKGVGSFKEGAKRNFLAIGVIYPEVMQGFVNADSNIQTIADLKGKKVAVGPTGSGTAITTQAIVNAYGLDFVDRKDFEPVYATFADAVNMFKDNQIDAAWNALAAPASAIVDVTTTKNIRFLEITGEQLAKLQKQFPLVAPYVIPAGTYKGVDKDVHTVALQAALYVRADMDEETVYNLTKILYEKGDDITKGHAMGKHIQLKTALDGITTPLHPGAAKYFKEKGLLK
ncbi:MAG: TAXI family TRAP transporter solute-binding subunit [Bacillota bacterium]